ncbi:MAG TPA: sigma-70 family RNA polymerase sigma factor [Steroidobacteraceae bacterium]|jgi:RNA polymerase sigma-70 factor (ECF subfamily)|nr:sigma-70 family RNA polymerase sigma factor [Steroidobacteraceae bacterium]
MAETNANSLEALLAQIALGNRAAFEALYRATANRLFGICLRVLAHRAEAEDALQDVFTVVWRKAAQFDPTRASATSWLAMIARNKAIDRLRSMPAQQARTRLELAKDVEDPGASPSQQVQTAIDRVQLEQCLERLEPRRRSLIRAAFFDGVTYEELAANIEAPLGSIKSWIRRGLMQLRECLDP